MTDRSLIRTARKVAAALRGETYDTPKYAVCDVGYPECRCPTCRARWSASKVGKGRR